MAKKVNNVIRLLEQRKINYQSFELPLEKLGAREAAELLAAPLEQVYKTIVVTRTGRGKPILAVIPGDREADLKAIARELGEKKVQLPTEKQAEALTGLQAGGISPLALLNKGFQVILDSRAQEFPEIYISGGERGLNIRLSPDDVATLTNGFFASISH